jgi:hypothetical protein
LEAALCGNQVIGYTGQGAQEYWLPEVIESVESGNVVAFAQSVLNKVKQLDGSPAAPMQSAAINRLASTYSAAQERADMQAFIQRMGLAA